MKRYFLVLILYFPIFLNAQERTPVKGLVTDGTSPLESVHIKNVSSKKYSVSNAAGEFFLGIAAGDTLVFSHVGMNDLISFITSKALQEEKLVFTMKENPNELEEVVVDQSSEINAVTLGIIPKKIKKLSVNERRLKTAGDFKPKHVLGIIGGGVSIDAILNAINGRTKKLKRNVDIEKKQRNIAFLENNYMTFMEKTMKLSQQDAQLLIGYIIEDEKLNATIASGNEGQMHLYLLEAWFKFEEERNAP